MIHIVVDLGFGDSGKGAITDRLAAGDPHNTVVIRYTGGSQAGHNVVIGDQSHVHSSFASGALRGVQGHMSHYCPINPQILINEAILLEAKTNRHLIDYCSVDPLCPMVTIFDQEWNKFHANKLRQRNTVGIGIGAAMDRHEKTPHRIFIADILHPMLLRNKLEAIRDYYIAKAMAVNTPELCGQDLALIMSRVELEAYMAQIKVMLSYVSLAPTMDIIWAYGGGNKNLILEGAQGIMLDRDHGVFPYVTYGYTTPRNAVELLGPVQEAIASQPVTVHHVTRCYQTRHGDGPISPGEDLGLKDPTNLETGFQGQFRTRPLDFDLIGYALSVSASYTAAMPTVIDTLHVTCMDRIEGFDLSRFDNVFEKSLQRFAWWGADANSKCDRF